MTSEEAIKELEYVNKQTGYADAAFDMAIKALNQEPCENATLKDIPPVTPQSKTGLWIKSRDSYGNNHFTCPFCEHDIATKYAGTWEDNYCSNCGARLESEDKK